MSNDTPTRVLRKSTPFAPKLQLYLKTNGSDGRSFLINHTVLRIERREQRIEIKTVRNATKFH